MCTGIIEAPVIGFRLDDATAPARQDVRSRDLELVRRIQAGDELAFRQVVERHQSRIYGAIHRILRNRQDTEDIAQEVFAKVYFSIGRFNGDSPLFTWIYRIALNECYGFLRKKRVHIAFESDRPDEAEGPAVRAPADTRPTPERAVADREFVHKLLARLPEETRSLLIWREVEGLSVTQLAEMTGMNENTLKVKLFRARKHLADLAARFSRPSGSRTRRER